MYSEQSKELVSQKLSIDKSNFTVGAVLREGLDDAKEFVVSVKPDSNVSDCINCVDLSQRLGVVEKSLRDTTSELHHLIANIAVRDYVQSALTNIWSLVKEQIKNQKILDKSDMYLFTLALLRDTVKLELKMIDKRRFSRNHDVDETSRIYTYTQNCNLYWRGVNSM